MGYSILCSLAGGAMLPSIHADARYIDAVHCFTQNCYPHRITYLSTTKNPHDKEGWTFHGQVFPFPYTSGASLLFRDGAEDHGP